METWRQVLPFYLSRDILQEFEEGELEFGDEAGLSREK
jgi:hypothetical protein